jgi:UDP-N-acetylglucosamine:LPS N-acetylglucosamine transferase
VTTETPRRVLVLMAEAGFGHRSAAQAVAAALEQRYGPACSVTIANPLADARTPAFLRNTEADYDRTVRYAPNLLWLGWRLSDYEAPAALVRRALAAALFRAVRQTVRATRPDVIVTTYPHYLYALDAVFAFEHRHIPLLTVLTDLVSLHRLWFHPVTDLCLVPTAHARRLALRLGIPRRRIRLTGIPVNPALAAPAAAPAERRAALGWPTDRPTLLVVGSRRVRRLAQVAAALDTASPGLPPLHLALVAGGDEALYARLQQRAWQLPVTVYNYVPNLPHLLLAADLVLAKAGGLIVAETLAAGKPLIVMELIAGQETGNAAFVLGAGAGELAAEPERVPAIVRRWLARDGRELAERAERARRVGRPRAAWDTAGLTWGAAEAPPRPAPERKRLLRLLRLLDEE